VAEGTGVADGRAWGVASRAHPTVMEAAAEHTQVARQFVRLLIRATARPGDRGGRWERKVSEFILFARFSAAQNWTLYLGARWETPRAERARLSAGGKRTRIEGGAEGRGDCDTAPCRIPPERRRFKTSTKLLFLHSPIPGQVCERDLNVGGCFGSFGPSPPRSTPAKPTKPPGPFFFVFWPPATPRGEKTRPIMIEPLAQGGGPRRGTFILVAE